MSPNKPASHMAYDIVPIGPSHIDQAVTVHIRAFPNFFLTFLGPRFLRQFYNSFTVDPAGVGFVAMQRDNGNLVGVVTGPLDPTGYFKRLLKRRWWAFCMASASAVLRRPSVIKRLLRAVFYRGEAPEGPTRSLLSSIAVAPEAQGMGIGKALTKAWLDEVCRRGSKGAYLTTDADENDSTNAFYRRSGWTLEKTFSTPQGRSMNRYIMDFAPKQR